MPSTNTVRQPSSSVPNSAWLALDSQLCFALYSTSLTMTKLYKPALDSLGLTYPQYLVMLALWETDSQSVSSLGARLQLDSGTLTPLLKRLQAAALITRDRSAEDERCVLISLTAEGRRLRTRALRVPRLMAEITGCPLDELRQLTQQLQRVRTRLQNTLQAISP